MKKSISVITVTYNSSRYLRNLLSSIYKNRENVTDVYVVDNNSTDKDLTREICRQFNTKMKIRFIDNRNMGFGRSCNYAARKSKSKYLLFLNPDCELQSNSMHTLLAHLVTNNADIVGGKAINYDKVTHRSVVRKPNMLTGIFEFSNLGKIFNLNSAHNRFYYEDLDILEASTDQVVDAVGGAYMLIRSDAFSMLNGFDENMFMYLEDIDLCKRACDLGMKVVFCPHSKIWHIGGASSQNKYRIHHQAWFNSRKYYFHKHFGVWVNLIVQPLFIIEEYILKKIRKI